MRQTGPGLNPLTDGQTPGSPILFSGGVTYTPGLSQSGGPNGSLFSLTDGRDHRMSNIYTKLTG